MVLGLIEPYIGTAGHALFSPWNGARGNEVELGIIYVTIRQTFIGISAISRAWKLSEAEGIPSTLARDYLLA